ncbi:hypothetical protein KXD40_008120 [Peronospora effusa]|uniref:Uncharacterized protein n=1 Tax=Peronospora effusa TaxID=542832 RepID=A0A3M6VDQ9_9STRA|nr:hypothetical protein DD238_005641 [Peronospora effusa]RQM12608.1 hypothetical protein DD237_004144 [Peronospora effusa]UIZ23985.1 hypothetical protein KXD40_008120 [Peronospora effusa]
MNALFLGQQANTRLYEYEYAFHNISQWVRDFHRECCGMAAIFLIHFRRKKQRYGFSSVEKPFGLHVLNGPANS